MRKISILFVAALAMVSCGNTYKAQTPVLTDQNDSVNYALGLVNGAQLKMMQMQNDSSDKTIAEFMDALQRGYDGEVEELSEAASVGQNIGTAIKMSEKTGLADNPAWTLNEKIFFQGLVNGIYADTTVMLNDFARDFFQNAYQAAAEDSTLKAGKPVIAKCPKTAKTITLKSYNDSLNYAFGFLNGSEIKMYVLQLDTTGQQTQDFIANLNKALNNKVSNPQLVNMGEQIGKSIKEQEPTGLIGIPELATEFDLIKQGFVNGLYNSFEVMDADQAGQYIQQTVDFIKFGNAKAEGEKFLAENALKDGVTVTESGLQYEVITAGKGSKHPTAESTVKVHYEGKLINGTVFDSSYQRGEPIEFPLNGVIKGWTEGVQLMTVGSKYRFYIPYNLGYGERGAGQNIPPYATLIFDVELLEIK